MLLTLAHANPTLDEAMRAGVAQQADASLGCSEMAPAAEHETEAHDGSSGSAMSTVHLHDHRPHGLIEIRAINGASFAEGGADHVVGTGISIEVYALHHQVGFEFATSAVTSGTHSVVPLEFIVKKPFHLSDDVEPYVGIGPMVVAVLDEEPGWHPGGVLAVGTALWAGPHLAMVLEGNGSLAHLGDGTHKDLEALASIAYRY